MGPTPPPPAAVAEGLVLLVVAVAVAARCKGRVELVDGAADTGLRLTGTDPARAIRVVEVEFELVVEVPTCRGNFVGMVGKLGTPVRLRFCRNSVMSQADRLRRNFSRFGPLNFIESGEVARATW